MYYAVSHGIDVDRWKWYASSICLFIHYNVLRERGMISCVSLVNIITCYREVNCTILPHPKRDFNM